MPKRTNEYQKLILAIQRHLASGTAHIEESKMLWDHMSEQEREVDIYIEDTLSNLPIKIAVECTSRSRKLGVSYIDETVEKHRSVGINNSVIVSDSGFTETAKTKAKKIGVELISYGEAFCKDWPEHLQSIKEIELQAIYQRIEFKQLDFGYDKNNLPTGFILDANVQVEEKGSFELVPLFDYFFSYIDKEVQRQGLPLILGESSGLKIEWDLKPPVKLIDKNKKLATCEIFSAIAFYQTDSMKLDKVGAFNKTPVASGIASEFGPFKDAAITLAQNTTPDSEGKPTYSLAISLNTD